MEGVEIALGHGKSSFPVRIERTTGEMKVLLEKALLLCILQTKRGVEKIDYLL